MPPRSGLRHHGQRILVLSAIARCDNNVGHGAPPPRHVRRGRRGRQLHARAGAPARRPVGGVGRRADARARARRRALRPHDAPRRLTDAGSALLPEARATLAAAETAREAVDAVRGGLRGTVTLGSCRPGRPGGSTSRRSLAAFRADHPDVELRARQGPLGRDGGAGPRRRAGLRLPRAPPPPRRRPAT